MISKNVVITINKEMSSMNDKLSFYQGDTGIDIHFTLKDFKYNVGDSLNSPTLDNATGGILVLDPEGAVVYDSGLSITDENTVKLDIDSRFTDVIGQYKFQIHVFDSLGGRVTIPPLTWEVKPLIGRVAPAPVSEPEPEVTDIAEELIDNEETNGQINEELQDDIVEEAPQDEPQDDIVEEGQEEVIGEELDEVVEEEPQEIIEEENEPQEEEPQEDVVEEMQEEINEEDMVLEDVDDGGDIL